MKDFLVTQREWDQVDATSYDMDTDWQDGQIADLTTFFGPAGRCDSRLLQIRRKQPSGCRGHLVDAGIPPVIRFQLLGDSASGQQVETLVV